jgi:Leucine Rich Repeat.
VLVIVSALVFKLYLNGNSVTTEHVQTFCYDTGLDQMSLAKNSFTDIHTSTFRNNITLRHLDLSENKLISIYPETSSHNRELQRLYLERNNITDIQSSAFRNIRCTASILTCPKTAFNPLKTKRICVI